MSQPNWSDDNDLIRDLGRALRPDETEHRVIEAAHAVLRWRSADPGTELAALLYDSDVDRALSVRASSDAPRALVFGNGSHQMEIEVSDSGIEGQLIPPEPGMVRLVTVDGTVTEAMTDTVGCFTFPGRRRGPVRLEWLAAGDRLVTAWIPTSPSRPDPGPD
ncbi:hypothetical protein [Virgisporangium aurantiacum]|uniref:Uncharacterized protein n=1 Tax=Virgisporangium aurantiacum TaxID=175570 RepID=A0A8J3Z5R0_9ACTN|nr:hypothetical protein [Virgisporangium aurantiacum]GIJ56947.1 hypothetical protein Vau01_044630 [Virgisporangium aurantiacum]